MILLCLAAIAIDGDTLVCKSGERIRLSGVEANERGGGCHLSECPTMPHNVAKAALQATVGRRLRCYVTGRSYNRLIADCYASGVNISCALLQKGAVVRWRRYPMGSCRERD